ncbi:hypothetical protein EV356DRAFT_35924 [Viridothelium virens]|uniref:Uncharacterized protein n=1 Tax=Viridothelium virens TaxID=1048519 RepID=A0A6A6GSW6_VIRVR|nr:hypothetical protein EV356DRAFT_35924 [Viridothelium virens]
MSRLAFLWNLYSYLQLHVLLRTLPDALVDSEVFSSVVYFVFLRSSFASLAVEVLEQSSRLWISQAAQGATVTVYSKVSHSFLMCSRSEEQAHSFYSSLGIGVYLAPRA